MYIFDNTCHCFREHGTCKYGDVCEFKHVKPATPAMQAAPQGTTTAASSKPTQPQIYSMDEKTIAPEVKDDILAEYNHDNNTIGGDYDARDYYSDPDYTALAAKKGTKHRV